MEEQEKIDSGTIVEVAKKRFQRAKDYWDGPRQLAIEDTRFALGDSDNNWQWPEMIYKQRYKIDRKPCLTINITAQHCNQIINAIRQNRPSSRILPVDSYADKKTAEILGGLIRSIQSYSDAETAHDIAAEHSIYGGEGYWRIITEYESPFSFNQSIKIKAIANPFSVYLDPCAKEADKSDAKWGFIFEEVFKDEVQNIAPGVNPASWGDIEKTGWMTKDTVLIAEYFYATEVDDHLYMFEDGQIRLKSELKKQGIEVINNMALIDGMPLSVINDRPTTREQWKWCKLIGGEDKPFKETDWIGSTIPIIAVVGKEVDVNGEIVRKGIVRDLKDPARIVNYSYSASVETIALQTKVPFAAAAEAIEGYEDIWENANIENRAYLPFNAFDNGGNALPKPERLQPAVMPTAQVQMLELSIEQMRAASGQQNANFGIRSDAQSGIGIQRLKQQGEIATFHFPDNLRRALKYEARVLIDLIPKVYTEKQVVRILGLDGKEQQAVLEPEMKAAYAEANGEIKDIFNPLMGKYDVAIDTGPSYQTQRQEAAESIQSLINADPSLMQKAGDIIVRMSDMPLGEELAMRLEKTIPPELLDDGKKNQIPPQVQMQMQQMDEAIGQLQAQLQQSTDAARQAQLKAQQAESKAISLQLEIDKRDAIKEIEAAMPESAPMEQETGQITPAEQARLEVELKKTAMVVAGNIKTAKIRSRASAPGEETEDDDEGEDDEMVQRMIAAVHPEGEIQQRRNDTQELMNGILNAVNNQQILLQQIAAPRVAEISIAKGPDGTYVGQRVERVV